MRTSSLYLDCINLRSVLNPEYKLKYCETAGWPAEWTNTMREIGRTIWLNNYATLDVQEVEEVEEVEALTVRSLLQFLSSYCGNTRYSRAYFY